MVTVPWWALALIILGAAMLGATLGIFVMALMVASSRREEAESPNARE